MLILILIANLIIGASAVLTAFSSGKVVVAGSEVILECRTNTSKKLLWRQRSLNASQADDPLDVIFTGNKFSNESAQKYKIIRESFGQFDLKFIATLNHGNEYMCIEPGGENFSSQLIVLSAEPKCYVNAMPVTSNIIVVDDDEYIELKCNLSFAGRWNPSMEWTQQINSENDWMVIETQEETEKRERISFTSTILGLNATHNVTSFICTTRFLEFGRRNTTTAENILEYSHNWTSPTFVLRTFYESNYAEKENLHEDGNMAMTGYLILVLTALVVSALLCIIVIVTVKLTKAKTQQWVTNNPAHPATNHHPTPTVNHPGHPATQGLVVNGLEQQVIYSDVEKKPVNSQKDPPTNRLRCEFHEPVIYSEVYKPGITHTDEVSSQQLSTQTENPCEITGADGTEYAMLPVFQSKQPFHQAKGRQDIFETSVYASIDHTIEPLPPQCNRLKS